VQRINEAGIDDCAATRPGSTRVSDQPRPGSEGYCCCLIEIRDQSCKRFRTALDRHGFSETDLVEGHYIGRQWVSIFPLLWAFFCLVIDRQVRCRRCGYKECSRFWQELLEDPFVVYVLIFQGLYGLMLRPNDCSLFFGCCCGDRVGKTSLMNQYLQLFIWDEIRGLLNSFSDFIRMLFVLSIFFFIWNVYDFLDVPLDM
jgi:hypothetical protein